ncbi:MAG: GNAT family N-acetyltransferase [Balneolaceae bacterium]|nr:MAG: GNAT family N-acetyltransferase [Balneolaceae bacterium]
MSDSFSVKTVHGKQLEPYIKGLAELRICVFREFPYLYDGSAAYERRYLKTYLNAPNSIAILVLHRDLVVGASTGLPLADENDEFQKPFIQAGINVSEVFYCGESILLPEFRGLGIYQTFITGREEHARKLGGFKTICFCAVSREKDHPLKPNNYTPLDAIWRKYGYEKRPDLHTTYRWKDIDEDDESDKKMVFWVKDL